MQRGERRKEKNARTPERAFIARNGKGDKMAVSRLGPTRAVYIVRLWVAFERESSLVERYERERQGCGHFSKPNDELNDL